MGFSASGDPITGKGPRAGVHGAPAPALQREHDERRRHSGRQRVDDEEQLFEGLRDDERGYRSQQLIAPLAGEDGADQAAAKKSPEVARRIAQPGDVELRLEQRELRDAGGKACKLPSGEFVDVPVAQRARRLLELADALRPERA
jgi:hypothetical protein